MTGLFSVLYRFLELLLALKEEVWSNVRLFNLNEAYIDQFYECRGNSKCSKTTYPSEIWILNQESRDLRHV